MKEEQKFPQYPYITVTLGMSGYFAVMIWLNKENPEMPFEEPYQTGIGRYRTREKAEIEAKSWAAAEELRYA